MLTYLDFDGNRLRNHKLQKDTDFKQKQKLSDVLHSEIDVSIYLQQ